MATPFVAGIIALLICRDGNISPAAMETKLKDTCLKNVITGIRKYPLRVMEARRLWATLSAVAACLDHVVFLGGQAIDNIQ